VQLGPVTADDRNGLTSLLLRSQNGPVPPGTRQIHVVLTMTRLDGDYNDGYADNISLSLLVPTRPSINANGVISASDFGASTAIAPGTWIEIYGSSMSQITRNWTSADFVGAQAPTSLSGVSVTVGGQPAYVGYISLNQVNALVPSSVGPGLQQVTVTSPIEDGIGVGGGVHDRKPDLHEFKVHRRSDVFNRLSNSDLGYRTDANCLHGCKALVVGS
jgi:hypothetical protein